MYSTSSSDMHPRTFALLVSVFPFIASACADDYSLNCSKELRPSVRVTVLDATGDAVVDAELTYSVDGAAPKPCSGGAEGRYVCGLEEEGRIQVRGARGSESGVGNVRVRKDACHADPEDLTLTLAATE